MRIGVWQQETLELHGEAVERVSEFTYLGSIISETGATDEDITSTIRKAQSTFSTLMPVWKEKCIRLQTKLRIFNTNVKSALLYGSEMDEPTDHETENLYQQVFKEDLERPLSGGYFKLRSMGKDATMPYRRKH